MTAVFTVDQSGDSSTNVPLGGGWWIVGASAVFSGSYPTGGETFDLDKAFGSGGRVRRAIALGGFRGLQPEYDKVNKKLKLFTVTTVATGAIQEHPAAAYDADLTASAVDLAFLIKYG
jgi:hypothetical protein